MYEARLFPLVPQIFRLIPVLKVELQVFGGVLKVGPCQRWNFRFLDGFCRSVLLHLDKVCIYVGRVTRHVC